MVSKGQIMATDKLLHLLAGIIIGMGVTLCTGSIMMALAIALAVGMIKEIIDMNEDGVFDFWDIFATLIGALLGSGFVWLCAYLQ